MSLDRQMTVLEAIAAAGRPLSAAEVRAATGLPRPTCYRLLQSLAEQRLVEALDGGYRIGARLIRLARLGQTDADAATAAAPGLAAAAADWGEATFLARVRGSGVEIIHVEAPADPARSYIHPGLGFRPLHACSCSKAVAAYADDGFRRAALKGPFRRYTAATQTDPSALEAEFAQILRDGYATCVEEVEDGVASVAAPVRLGAEAPFAIGATGPIRRFGAARRGEIGAALIQAAEGLALALDRA